MHGLLQRTARGLYDENAKLFSLKDENAVFNPKAMLESAALDALSSAVMGGVDRRNGTSEPARTIIDAEGENDSRAQERGKNNKGNRGNAGNKGTEHKQDFEQDYFIKNMRDGNFAIINDMPLSVLRNPEIQKRISEESGIHISGLDNRNPNELMRKFRLAAVEMGRKSAKG